MAACKIMRSVELNRPVRESARLQMASHAENGYGLHVRLNRFLASAGLGSRRSVEALIEAGRVRVNGRIVTNLATTISTGDAVKVGNRMVRMQPPVYAVLNKPRGVVCSADDERGRRTIFDYLPRHWPRVFHVGRLDKESEGLLIVTNDGDLSLALTHPRFHIEKEYEVMLERAFVSEDRERLLKGFRIEGGYARVERVAIPRPRELKIVLRQGLKRQIRLMLFALGYEVARLRRVRVGPITLGEMRPGEWRLFTPPELREIKRAAASASLQQERTPPQKTARNSAT
jgi:23S rRNA pseudouridine2605 synthase